MLSEAGVAAKRNSSEVEASLLPANRKIKRATLYFFP
jgi:hypothetical protein